MRVRQAVDQETKKACVDCINVNFNIILMTIQPKAALPYGHNTHTCTHVEHNTDNIHVNNK